MKKMHIKTYQRIHKNPGRSFCEVTAANNPPCHHINQQSINKPPNELQSIILISLNDSYFYFSLTFWEIGLFALFCRGLDEEIDYWSHLCVFNGDERCV